MKESFETVKNQIAHIPFVSNYGIDFCHFRDENGLWKAHYYDGKWKRLILNGIPRDCTECQISSEKDGDNIIVSLICGYSSININFCGLYLVTFKGRTLSTLKMVDKRIAISGHVNRYGVNYATPKEIFLYGNSLKYKLFPKLFRMCYDFENHDVTYLTYGNGIQFRTYSIDRKLNCYEYTNQDGCLYKFCKGENNNFYYATKNENDRHILECQTPIINKIDISTLFYFK